MRVPQRTIKIDINTYNALTAIGKEEERTRAALVRRFVRLYQKERKWKHD